MHENTTTTETEVADGWVKTTVTSVTYQEQPDQVASLLASRRVALDQVDAIDEKLGDLGYEGE